jgi:hypothetical protein
MSTANDILRLERELRDARSGYLRLHGWASTCNTPGSFWMWTRDFANEDEAALKRHPKTASPFQPMGRVMADTDTAVQMTMRSLDRTSDEDDEAA